MITLERQICGVSVKVRTHDEAHLDEWLALWLAERFATRAWVMNHCTNADLPLGIEGGEFDEHAHSGQQTKSKECCATLMAKSLGVSDNRALSHMLKHVSRADIDGAGGPFALYNLVKMMNAEYPDQPVRVMEWAFFALDAKYAEQQEFAASYEEAKKGKIEEVALPDSTVTLARVLIVHTDRKKIVAAAVANPDLRPDAVIQRRSNRQVMIFTILKPSRRLRMGPIVSRLRLGEAKVVNRILTGDQKRQLSGHGFSAGDETWYYNPRGEMILNGANSNKEVPPTKMEFGKVVGAVCWGIRDQLKARSPRRDNKGSSPVIATSAIAQPEVGDEQESVENPEVETS